MTQPAKPSDSTPDKTPATPQQNAPDASQGPEPTPTPSMQSTPPTDAERAELAELREADRQRKLEAERARAEAEVAAKAPKPRSAYDEDGEPDLDISPRLERELFLQLSIPHQIQSHYLYGRGTIQDYARLFKLEVPEVLEIISQRFDIGDVAEVETIGDLIDPSVINTSAGDKPFRDRGDTAKVPFSLN